MRKNIVIETIDAEKNKNEMFTRDAVRNVTVRPFIQIGGDDLMNDREFAVLGDCQRVALAELRCMIVDVSDAYDYCGHVELGLVDFVRFGV